MNNYYLIWLSLKQIRNSLNVEITVQYVFYYVRFVQYRLCTHAYYYILKYVYENVYHPVWQHSSYRREIASPQFVVASLPTTWCLDLDSHLLAQVILSCHVATQLESPAFRLRIKHEERQYNIAVTPSHKCTRRENVDIIQEDVVFSDAEWNKSNDDQRRLYGCSHHISKTNTIPTPNKCRCQKTCQYISKYQTELDSNTTRIAIIDLIKHKQKHSTVTMNN